MTKKIFIDPGHGAKDSGAVSGKHVEKAMNLAVSLEVKRLLTLNGFNVMLSRVGDTFPSLPQRSAMANKFKADLCISIHHNAGGGSGYEVIHSIYKGKSEYFAKILARQFDGLGQKPHGVGIYSKKGEVGDYYAMIREPHMPAVISEFCFIDSEDVHNADTRTKLLAEARAIAKAVCVNFGIIFKADGEPMKPAKLSSPVPTTAEEEEICPALLPPIIPDLNGEHIEKFEPIKKLISHFKSKY